MFPHLWYAMIFWFSYSIWHWIVFLLARWTADESRGLLGVCTRPGSEQVPTGTTLRRLRIVEELGAGRAVHGEAVWELPITRCDHWSDVRTVLRWMSGGCYGTTATSALLSTELLHSPRRRRTTCQQYWLLQQCRGNLCSYLVKFVCIHDWRLHYFDLKLPIWHDGES